MAAMVASAVASARARTRSLRVALESRARQGLGRAHASLIPIVQASIAATIAYFIAVHALGHPFPFFAASTVWVCLGFSADRQVRKVIEVALGVTVGIALGDVFASLFGTGALQIGIVLLLAGMSARFIDRGAVLATNAGVQAVVVVGMPSLLQAGPFSRVVDALVGGGMALVVALLLPGDPRRRARGQAKAAYRELAVVLDSVAAGLRADDPRLVEDALERGRRTQPVLDEWDATLRSARSIVRLSPVLRGHANELAELRSASVFVDRAIRSARTIARRALVVVDRPTVPPDAIASVLIDLAACCRAIGDAFVVGAQPAGPERDLAQIAGRLSAKALGVDEPEEYTLVHLMRPLLIDLRQSLGLTHAQACAGLAEL